MNTSIAQSLAKFIQARANCVENGNNKWYDKWDDRIEAIMKNAPSGSGIDNGTTLLKIVLDKSNSPKVLMFLCEYHHMDENGSYDGWTSHYIKVSPTWNGVDIVINGENRNGIKDYLHDVYDEWLNQELEDCD